jgi:hypothetical protein
MKSTISKFYLISLIGLLCYSCVKDPCKDVDKGPYIYPEKPTGISFSEAIEFYKIPTNIIPCMSSEDLFQTCMTYPEIRLFWTGAKGLQDGFNMVRDFCNGFDKLLSRSDAYSVIVNAYKELKIEGDWNSWTDLEIGHYMSYIIYHEVFLAQREIIESLTRAQKIELTNLTLDNLKLKLKLNEYYGYAGLWSSVTILSRIMYIDNYQPFMKEYANSELVRIQTATMTIHDSDFVELVIRLSEEYLKTLEKYR